MATRALSADAPRASCGNEQPFSPSRRAFVSAASVATAVVALPIAASATEGWTAANWLRRWHDRGCGACLDGNGHVRLTGLFSDAGALLGELTPERYDAIAAWLRAWDKFQGADPAVLAALDVEALDREWDNKETITDIAAYDAAEAEWSARSTAAFDRMIAAPARTPRGLAAKLRVAREWNLTDGWQTVLNDVIGRLEAMA